MPWLNGQQAAAVQKVSGPALLLAVPGSGKTSVIVARLGYMLLCCGIAPESILTVTYTVAATRDMRARFQSLFGKELADRLEFRTINGLCARIIRAYERACNTQAFELVSDEGAIARLINELHVRSGGAYLQESDLKNVRRRIAFCKNMMLSGAEIKCIKIDGVRFPELYEMYREHMRKNRLMDFDDQMVYALQILRKYPECLRAFQTRYQYVNVDEAQDTSKIQHEILQLLAAEHRNLFMVGDEDQSIYGFRAAYPQAMLDFPRRFPEAELLMMEKNYRSTPEIVQSADRFIRRNGHRYDKHMTAARSHGAPIRHIQLEDSSRQSGYLARIAKNCTETTAVLYRNNDSALPLIDLLDKQGIPYRCRQLEGGFFTHYTVRDVLDIIRFSAEPENGELFSKIYYKFGCGLKKETLQYVLNGRKSHEPILEQVLAVHGLQPWTQAKLKSLQTHLQRFEAVGSFQTVYRIIHFMGYGDYLSSRNGDFSRLNILLALANQNPGLPDFLKRLDELSSLVSSGGGGADSAFVLSTIHSSKGLEYDRVILIDVADGLFPSIPEPEPRTELPEEELLALEEDRRLFYVALTRAKNSLEIITCKNEFGRPAKPVSSFVRAVLEPEGRKEKQLTRPNTKRLEVGGTMKAYAPGIQLAHKSFGKGILLERKDGIISVRFDSGVRRLDLRQCLEKKLISILT